MATLHLQNVPDDLYEKLQQLAASTLLESALPTETKQLQDNTPNKSVKELLAEINRRRELLPADLGLPDSTAMIREDRDR